MELCSAFIRWKILCVNHHGNTISKITWELITYALQHNISDYSYQNARLTHYITEMESLTGTKCSPSIYT